MYLKVSYCSEAADRFLYETKGVFKNFFLVYYSQTTANHEMFGNLWVASEDEITTALIVPTAEAKQGW